MNLRFSSLFLRSYGLLNQLSTTTTNNNIMMPHLKAETNNASSTNKVPKLPVGILVNILRDCRSIALLLETSKKVEYHRQLKSH